MSIEAQSAGTASFWRVRNLFTTRNGRRAVVSLAGIGQETRPVGAMFQDAQNTNIRNSTFNIFPSGPSVGGHFANIDDFNQTLSPTTHHTPHSVTSPVAATAQTSPSGDNEFRQSDTLTSAPSDLYRDRLQRKNLGHPLWIPGPNERLPVAYRETGVMFGDVGVITAHGSFLYLFSVVHEATHPRNVGIHLPSDFVPFASSPDACEIEECRDFDGFIGSYLADDSVRRVDLAEDASRTVLQTSARQAAILALPETVHTASMLGIMPFRRYIRKHLQSWYSFARNVKGWDVMNGDIRVVHSSRKSSGYGIATVSNGTADLNTELVFSVNTLRPDSETCKYSWSHTGCATVKAGPLSTSDSFRLVNQCLFVGTIDFKLGDEEWKAVEDTEVPLLPCHQGECLKSESSRWQTSISTSSPGDSTSAPTDTRILSLSWKGLDVMQGYSARNTMLIPSNILADILLQAVPNASYVSVCTQDWGPYYTDSVRNILQFVVAVLSANDICVDNGLVYLRPRVQCPHTVNGTYENGVEWNHADTSTQIHSWDSELSDLVVVLDHIRCNSCKCTLESVNLPDATHAAKSPSGQAPQQDDVVPESSSGTPKNSATAELNENLITDSMKPIPALGIQTRRRAANNNDLNASDACHQLRSQRPDLRMSRRTVFCGTVALIVLLVCSYLHWHKSQVNQERTYSCRGITNHCVRFGPHDQEALTRWYSSGRRLNPDVMPLLLEAGIISPFFDPEG